MEQITIKPQEAGQRLDKFLRRYLQEATSGFLYKMLRKKNITLNAGKAEGSEILCVGDQITFFFSAETFRKFRGDGKEEGTKETELIRQSKEACQIWKHMPILYEDEHVLLASKPAGVLSQKAEACDLSLNEWFVGYLLEQGEVTAQSLRMFRPSVCNRLDRNTSGIVICGKTLRGSQEMSRLLQDRNLHKYYLFCVEGQMKEGKTIEGYMWRDEKSNKTCILDSPCPGSRKIATSYRPLVTGREGTLVEALLITGRTHHIRAHLASEGFPLMGDYKYGERKQNDKRKKQYGITHQLLHAHRLVFPTLTGAMEGLSGREIIAPVPAIFYATGIPIKSGREMHRS